MTDEPKWGHGWVTPRSDGSRTKCGGPLLCQVCHREQVTLEREQRTAFEQGKPQGRVLMVCHCMDGGGDAHVHA